jgi:hypothetical protein
MPKPPKRTQPKVDLREDELKEIRVNIRTSVYEAIVQYTEFHRETMGEPKPSESKVVDCGMESFFESDEAFQMYLKKRPKSVQPVVAGDGAKGGGPGNAGGRQGRGTSLQGE